ncbi:hypothetical protein HMPREF2563_06935 [Staphylococcus sp. HMSC057G10]|uniref:hypothetical protein n=1 Tax=Staphylococcus TaxID=1279 RepID=UPI0008A83D93|nr:MULTISPECIES: hypothetical protein [Staphylococcus]OHO94490.1 hypothetical protein HMPREF2563_06935 [Staphylococcus sp. HMSC057G10]
MKTYNLSIEETLKFRREYTIKTNENIDVVLEKLENKMRYVSGTMTPSEILLDNTEIELISYTDETDCSSPLDVEYEIEDVMEDE